MQMAMSMKEPGKLVEEKDMVPLSGQMAIFMKATSKQNYVMDRVQISCQMAMSIKEPGKL
jgi:hypothetical protein